MTTPLDSATARARGSRTDAASKYGKDKLGGVTLFVIYDSKLVWTRSYGYADQEKRIAASKQTVYRIGSITRMFTALMLVLVVEAGRVRLSDPVEKFFPEVNRVQGRSPIISSEGRR